MRDGDINKTRRSLVEDSKIYAQLCERRFLTESWKRVWRNAGASGGDRITVHDFAARAQMHIGLLAGDLASGRYQPGPLRSVDIPKRSGGLRRLNIPCVVDRVAQTAAAIALSPFFEEEFENGSFGYRPGRSVSQAVARIQSLYHSGFTHVIDADIDDYFDTIPHDGLLKRLSESMSDGPLTELIGLWLAHAAPHGRGLAQGSPLSPLLANLYLDRLDERFSQSNVRIVRFADDFVILAQSEGDAQDLLPQVEKLLAQNGLALNRDKTQVTDFNRGFRFLGHMFIRSLVFKATPESMEEDETTRILAELAKRDAQSAEAALAEEEDYRSAERQGYSPGLRNLHITTPGRRLSLRNQAFTVEEKLESTKTPRDKGERWRELLAIPHQKVDRIDLGPGTEFTAESLDHALSTNTIVCMVDGYGATQGTLAPALAPRARRHLSQAATTLEPNLRLNLAQLIVMGRLRNQRAILRKLCRERDKIPPEVTRALSGLTHLIGHRSVSRVLNSPSVATAMGYEGAAAASYWPAISSLAHPDFSFSKRQRGDPDPANITLNFLSWLLHRDVSVAVLSAGLHPGFGSLHAADDNHDACIYDLMEEFRSHMVEGLFVYLTNRRILRKTMFSKLTGTWRMKHEGSQAIIRAYEKRANSLITWPPKARRQSFRKVILTQAHTLAHHHEGESQYQPFELDY